MKKTSIYFQAIIILIISTFLSWAIVKLRFSYEFIAFIDPIYHLWLLGPSIASIVLYFVFREKKFSIFAFSKIQNIKILITTILVMLLAISLAALIQYYLGFISKNMNEVHYNFFNQSFSYFGGSLIKIFLLLILAGFSEEIMWRGYLYHKLEKLTWFELVFTLNTIWAIWHFPFMPFNSFLQYFLFWALCVEFGIILIFVRQQTKSSISSMVLHSFTVILLGVIIFPYFKVVDIYGGGWPNYVLAIIIFPISYYYYSKGKEYHLIKSAH
jgi:membrane protease YdiL (CAAX protease family)